MWVHLDGHYALSIRLVSGIVVDLASQLIGLTTVHAPGLAALAWLDLAQPLKEQDTARVVHADLCNSLRDFVCCVLIHAVHMVPEILVAVFAFHWLACEPLLFGNAFHILHAD